MFGRQRTLKSSEKAWIDLKCWNAEFQVVLAKFLQYSDFKTGVISELRSLLNRARANKEDAPTTYAVRGKDQIVHVIDAVRHVKWPSSPACYATRHLSLLSLVPNIRSSSTTNLTAS